MSHTTICFLVKEKDFDDAESRLMMFLDTEHSFDSLTVMPDKSGTLTAQRQFLDEFIGEWNWKKAADGFLEQAEDAKDTGNLDMYGCYLIKAGELYSQYLNTGTYVFNIETGDYSVPENPKGWWLIAVDFHY